MENPEEILHSLEEFSKMKPKDIPRELEEYLCFVAKTGNPIYQWPIIKSLFREKLLSVITEFYESSPSMDIPPCPNVEMFNYDMMKNFILEKLETFAAAPFTVQRICELLTTPRKEYNRLDKYMRALEKNILVVSTTEPGRRSTENGEGIMNGIESEHLPESSNSSHDINIEDMDESPSNWTRHDPNWTRQDQVTPVLYKNAENEELSKNEVEPTTETNPVTSFESEQETKAEIPSSSTADEPKIPPQETVITCTSTGETLDTYVSVEPQETTYQNLSEESNSNSSDSSSSTSIPESKEVVIEEKESVEPVTEVKIDAIVVQKEQEDEPKIELTVPEKSDPEPVSSEEISFEPTQSEPELDIPKVSSDEVSSEASLDSQTTETTQISESSSEADEKPEEKEAEQAVDKIQEKEETPVVEVPEVLKIPQTTQEDDENIVDSSTDIDEETKPELKEDQPEEAEVKNVEDTEVVNSDNGDNSDNKTDETATPMEVDVRENQEKKSDTEEPSSSVETFVKLMSAYYSRD